MAEKQTFQCSQCDQKIEVAIGTETPRCCEHPMDPVPMDQCTLSSTAEHSRLDDSLEPCDDGRAG